MSVTPIKPEECVTICGWNLVEFSIEIDGVTIYFDRESAAEIHRNLTEFLEYPPSAS